MLMLCLDIKLNRWLYIFFLHFANKSMPFHYLIITEFNDMSDIKTFHVCTFIITRPTTIFYPSITNSFALIRQTVCRNVKSFKRSMNVIVHLSTYPALSSTSNRYVPIQYPISYCVLCSFFVEVDLLH